MQKAKSFAETSIQEALSRRVGVHLVLRPVRPGGDRQLATRVLAAEPDGSLVLDTPRNARGAKVFVPDGWPLSIVFRLGEHLLQGRSKVTGRRAFPPRPPRRIDALIVARPADVRAFERRVAPRFAVDLSRPIAVSLWPGQPRGEPAAGPRTRGRLVDWSQGGLGLLLEGPPLVEPGQGAVICLQAVVGGERTIARGVLRYARPEGDGRWRAGFGDARVVNPGEDAALTDFLASCTGA